MRWFAIVLVANSLDTKRYLLLVAMLTLMMVETVMRTDDGHDGVAGDGD